jgi:hypothetical protein
MNASEVANVFWQMDLSGRDTDAGKLTSYIGREDHQLRDRRGQPMSDHEIEEFIDRSKDYTHEKQIVISPENGNELSDDELSLAARRNMSEFIEDRPTADYCYAIHRDTDQAHVQVAITGAKRDLYADKGERQQMRTNAREQFHERERQHGRARRERARKQEHQRRRDRQQQRERDQERDYGRGLD